MFNNLYFLLLVLMVCGRGRIQCYMCMGVNPLKNRAAMPDRVFYSFAITLEACLQALACRWLLLYTKLVNITIPRVLRIHLELLQGLINVPAGDSNDIRECCWSGGARLPFE